jgi:hypothetical protein
VNECGCDMEDDERSNPREEQNKRETKKHKSHKRFPIYHNITGTRSFRRPRELGTSLPLEKRRLVVTVAPSFGRFNRDRKQEPIASIPESRPRSSEASLLVEYSRRDAMIINKDNNGKPAGFIETLISNERVVTVNATRQAATITTRDRNNGKVKTETFYGTLPLLGKD